MEPPYLSNGENNLSLAGVGKTYLCQGLAQSFGFKVCPVNASSFKDKFLGETEKKINGIFQQANKVGKTIVFLDEVKQFARYCQVED